MKMYKIRNNLMEDALAERREDRLFLLYLAIIGIILCALIYVNSYVLGCVVVSGHSMDPTFYGGEGGKGGDILIMNKNRVPTYGDVVIINGELNNKWLIKRVIALGGDTVKFEDGFVYLMHAGESDFTKLEENYILTEGASYWDGDGKTTPNKQIVVGDGEVFFLGDNRKVSKDSRSEFGTCNLDQIEGVVSEWVIKNKDEIKVVSSVFVKIKSLFTGKDFVGED